MTKTFTPELLIKYIYRETTISERLIIQDALHRDYALREEYLELYKAYKQLPKVKFRPSSKTIRAVMEYSRATAIENCI